MRQLYAIADAGRAALAEPQRRGLSEVRFKHDPFDLALTRLSPAMASGLAAVPHERLATLEAMSADTRRVNGWARPRVGLPTRWALRHGEHRLLAEAAFLREMIEDADAIAADARG